jgi:hypothetical protein
MRWQVGLTTVPAAAATVRFRDLFLRHGAMSRQGLPDPITNPETSPPALCLERGFPTARLARARVEGKPGHLTPFAVTALCDGERLAPDIGHPGYTVMQSAPSYAAASLKQGRGGTRKAEYCLLEADGN